jgi:FkbM family methyltransferase
MRVVHEATGVVRHIWTHPANNGRRMRMLSKAVQFQLRGRVFGQWTLVSIGNHSKIWAELHRRGSSRAVYANPPDIEMRVWQSRLRPGDLFLDIGANVGIYSVIAAELGAELMAVEPDPETAARLRNNLALNGYTAQIFECAVGAQSGMARFTVGLDTINRIATDGNREVPVRTVDDILGERQAHGVKIDVEGFEIDVLRGAEKALSEWRLRLIQLEWNSTSIAATGEDRKPVQSLLTSHGYTLYRSDTAGQLWEVDNPGFGPDVFAVAPSTSP